MAEAPAPVSDQSAWFALLEKHTVADILPANMQLISVDASETPLAGFKRIVDHHILSAPVFDQQSGHYVGFLDVRDLVSFVVFQAEEAHKDAEAKAHQAHQAHATAHQGAHQAHQAHAPKETTLSSIFDSATKMYANPMDGITVSYLAKRNKFVPVHAEDSLARIVEILSSPSIHRVPVIDKEDRLIGIISQSNIIQFLQKHKDELGAVLSKTIEETQLGSRPVIPVSTKATALETFKVMGKYNKSGIAVIDNTGRLVGNTSGSDLKLFLKNPEKYARAFALPILDFLSLIRQMDVSETKAPTITVSEKDTIGKVIGKLAATKIHRVFCADDASGYKPSAVISITDILKHIMETKPHA